MASQSAISKAHDGRWLRTNYDDASYSQLAEMAANDAIEDPYLQFLYERTATLLVPIAGLYALFGPFELLGQL
jgi:hypothetical protein